MSDAAEEGGGRGGTDGVEIETYGLCGVDNKVVMIED
jgi:hypothetical protein